MIAENGKMPAAESVEHAWERWLEVARSRCHLHYELEGGSLDAHISICLAAGVGTIARISRNITAAPARVLEIGCSIGVNCLALAGRFPGTEVMGIDLDLEAVRVGDAMARRYGHERVTFVQGIGEQLPFKTAYFDLIICHTVIEHVRDVGACIGEMARVLRPGGVIHLEAPNYLWPRETHLGIFTVPMCPKPLMRFLARLQGVKGSEISYADHLQLVNPFLLERLFRSNGLTFENLTKNKMRMIAGGDDSQAIAYKRFARMLQILGRTGLAQCAVGALCALGLYPSLIYEARRPAETR